MTAIQPGIQHDTDVLIRRVNRRLATLRPHESDAPLAERLAASLRELVVSTAGASAADRARVRAAVHYFALRRDGRNDRRRPPRSIAENLRVVNEIARDLGRDDLVVQADPATV